MNKEIVQLIGYGLGDIFYGWIVTCREDLDVNYAMGRPDKVLARGYVDLRDDSKSITHSMAVHCHLPKYPAKNIE